MHHMMRRIRGAAGMGLTWALGWGLVGGVLEFFANFIPALNVVDMWIQSLAIPGFIAGAAFSVVLGVAGRGRAFGELSLPRFASWGATGGLLLGATLFLIRVANAGLPASWLPTMVVLGTLTTLSAASAAGTLALARRGEASPALDGPSAPKVVR